MDMGRLTGEANSKLLMIEQGEHDSHNNELKPVYCVLSENYSTPKLFDRLQKRECTTRHW